VLGLSLTHLDVTHLDVTHLDVTHLDVTHLDVTHLDVTHLDVTHLDVSFQISFFLCHQSVKCDRSAGQEGVTDAIRLTLHCLFAACRKRNTKGSSGIEA